MTHEQEGKKRPSRKKTVNSLTDEVPSGSPLDRDIYVFFEEREKLAILKHQQNLLKAREKLHQEKFPVLTWKDALVKTKKNLKILKDDKLKTQAKEADEGDGAGFQKHSSREWQPEERHGRRSCVRSWRARHDKNPNCRKDPLTPLPYQDVTVRGRKAAEKTRVSAFDSPWGLDYRQAKERCSDRLRGSRRPEKASEYCLRRQARPERPRPQTRKEEARRDLEAKRMPLVRPAAKPFLDLSSKTWSVVSLVECEATVRCGMPDKCTSCSSFRAADRSAASATDQSSKGAVEPSSDVNRKLERADHSPVEKGKQLPKQDENNAALTGFEGSPKKNPLSTVSVMDIHSATATNDNSVNSCKLHSPNGATARDRDSARREWSQSGLPSLTETSSTRGTPRPANQDKSRPKRLKNEATPTSVLPPLRTRYTGYGGQRLPRDSLVPSSACLHDTCMHYVTSDDVKGSVRSSKPVSLQAKALYQDGHMAISVMSDRHGNPACGKLKVHISVIHQPPASPPPPSRQKSLREKIPWSIYQPRNRPRQNNVLPKRVDRDVVSSRAELPPFDTRFEPTPKTRAAKRRGKPWV